MKSFLIANPKGGSGKSTLSINLAGYLAHCGHTVQLGDIDRQQSAHEWLQLRPEHLPPIGRWEVDRDKPLRPPKGTSHAVLDTPAGLHGKAFERILKQVNRVIVPVQPSLFDMLATRHFRSFSRTGGTPQVAARWRMRSARGGTWPAEAIRSER